VEWISTIKILNNLKLYTGQWSGFEHSQFFLCYSNQNHFQFDKKSHSFFITCTLHMMMLKSSI